MPGVEVGVRILLIQPRWMAPEHGERLARAVLAERPGATATLVGAVVAPAPGLAVLPLPRLRNPRVVLPWLRELRRVKYAEAIVLADSELDDYGYFGAEVIACAARAGARRLGLWRPLRLRTVLADEFRRGAAEKVVAWMRSRRDARKRRRIVDLRVQSRAGAVAVTACPLCRVEIASSRLASAGPDWCLCPECGSLYLDHIPSPDVLARLYAGDYYSGESLLGYQDYFQREGKRRLEAFCYLSRRRDIAGPAAGRYLDVGCAIGNYLDVAREQGWETYGVEVSAWAAGHCRGKGHTVLQQDFLALDVEQRFSFMTLMDVVEHMTDPLAVFPKVRALLGPGGVCVMRTPDPARLLPGYLEDVTHLWFPSADAISRLAEGAGLEVLRVGESLYADGALDAWLRRPHA